MAPDTYNRRAFLQQGAALAGAGLLPKPLVASAGGDPLRFLVVGDWGRSGADYQVQVAEAMRRAALAWGTRFVVSTGDNFYKMGVKDLSDPKWDRSFERVYSEALGPWYAVLGNHDYRGSVEAQIERTFRSDRWRMPDYWFDLRLTGYGRPDVHLFFVNTVAWVGAEKFPFGLFGSGLRRGDRERQHRWLESRLSGSDAAIKLVFGHYPIYSIGTHGGGYELRDLDALLQRHGVTAYVNGHDHCLYDIAGPGLDYICSGAGSQMLADYSGGRLSGCVLANGCRTGPPTPSQPRWLSFLAQSKDPEINLCGGFALFEVGHETVRFRFLEPAANEQGWRERHSRELQARTALA